MPPRLRRLLPLVALLLPACRSADSAPLSSTERERVAREVEERLRTATDLGASGDPLERLLGLYPDTGRVVSAGSGMVVTSRDSLAAALGTFWSNVGRNMRSPQWRWGTMHVDVLAPDAAVVTATYRIPHLTPRGEPHVVGGAWTAVFQRRDGRWVVVQEHLSDVLGPASPSPE